jgi:HEAT repeat protein
MVVDRKQIVTGAVVVAGLAILGVLAYYLYGYLAGSQALAQIRSDDPAKRERGIEAVGEKKTISQDDRAALRVAVVDSNPRVAAKAVATLARHADQSDLPVIRKVVAEEKRPEVREEAIRQLERYGQPAVETLVSVVEKEDEAPQARAAAADALGRQKAVDGLKALVQAMRSPNPQVAGRAYAAVRIILGTDYGWRPNLSAEKKEQIVQRISRFADEKKDAFAEGWNRIQPGKKEGS